MTGPRTRLARHLALVMLRSLHEAGPATMPTLLARVGYLPADIERVDQTDPITAAAIRMAIRELMNTGRVAVDVDGRLRHHLPGQPMPRTTQNPTRETVREEHSHDRSP